MKVIIAGGGTGGHLFPGLAIAEEFRRRDGSAEIVFVGTERGIEAKIIPREGYPIRFLRSQGIVGKSFTGKAKGVAGLFLSFFDARRILAAVSPDIVIGVGGYASGAIVAVADLKSIPTMIHEQNSVPGLTNRILGRIVRRICVTYHESLSSFPMNKTFLTGNPIRRKILKGDRDAACRLFSLNKDLFTVFIFGGSSGAQAINRTMVDSLNHLSDLKSDIQFLHQTGDRDFEGIRDAYRKTGVKGTVAPFIYQMAEAYAVADVVVSRAGATTLAELTALGKPAILIPFPHAAGRHQEFNAMKLREMGAAMVMLEDDLGGEALAGAIREVYLNADLRAEMKSASKGLGRPDACTKIVDVAMSLMRNG
ncbi:MAG: undecaprenyldiphospho-muramoylpentapeptide beta-N-acetylglucosaminyltransferase [Nitrospiraceae bacterium]|nr:undecaprenyldiphospho-muramoylpentapeptide beta-N-acetylglucosaminyltransferase [Nitrospiraceae bacterium]